MALKKKHPIIFRLSLLIILFAIGYIFLGRDAVFATVFAVVIYFGGWWIWGL